MNFKVEQLEEKNMVKLVIEATNEEFEIGLEKAYQKNKSKMNVQGFRKGKAPRKMIEKLYGQETFFEDAANAIIPDAYSQAAQESGLDIVSQPQVDVIQLEKDKPFIFTAEVAVKPEVELGEYKGIEVAKIEGVVSDEELATELDKVREKNSRTINVEDRAVQDGDEAVIDFEGFVDGEAFDGGKGENHALTIGSHSFIDTFEEQLIGKNIAEAFEVNVTFPEDYHVENLKGKAAIFKGTVNEIKVKELPELDDDFAQDVSDFDTLVEYKEDVKAKLITDKEKEATTKKESEVIDKIVENSKMDIPEPMIQTQVKQMAEEFSQRLQQQGLSVEQYFQFTGITAEKLLGDMKPEALKRIKTRLVLEAIVKAENIEATDAELDEELVKMAELYKMEIEKIKEFMGENETKQIKEDIAIQKAVTFVTEAAVEK
ncbi:trigger factor [[Clostridium] fimetarium]|uniref:Trigger factor n=1 Tax=[Clostridium] fimetarium TaxID=99656 RepID=A0A1I0RLF0_9FIRM|nr:trigger factor [[Clostridium] fimetarium]SEW41825.1 trigger factor [[Clostridium] fimetarium]